MTLFASCSALSSGSGEGFVSFEVLRQTEEEEFMILQPLQEIRVSAIEDLSNQSPVTSHPVVLVGAALDWPAMSSLTLGRLREAFGNVKVPVRETDDEFKTFFAAAPTSHVGARKMMDLRTSIDSIQLKGTPGVRPRYAGNIDFLHDPAVARQMRGLVNECHFPSCFPQQCEEEYRLWIGAAGQRSTIHSDPYHNFNAQIAGRKRVIVFPPNQHEAIYAMFIHSGLWASPIDPLLPDYDTYPKFKKAEGFEYELREGDILYMPRFWWHYFEATTAAVNLNRWVFTERNAFWHQQPEARPYISYTTLLEQSRRKFQLLSPDVQSVRKADFDEFQMELLHLEQ